MEFFSRPKACLRASPLPKQFGWNVHHDAEGRIAIHAVGSVEYARLGADTGVKVTPAMRSKRQVCWHLLSHGERDVKTWQLAA